MNDLKNDEKKKEVFKYIAYQLNRLLVAYDQENSYDVEKLEKTVKLISNDLAFKKDVNKIILDNVYLEIVNNYILYRKINAAVYLTAFAKIIKK